MTGLKHLEGIEWGAYNFFDAHQIPVLIEALSAISLLASYPALVLLLILVLVVLRIQKRYSAMLFLAGCFLASVVLAECLKILIARPRLNDPGESSFTRYGLPSESAWLSFVLYLGAAWLISRYWRRPAATWSFRLAALVLVLAMGFAKMYLGQHFLFDVLTGWLGAIVVLLTAGLWLREPALASTK